MTDTPHASHQAQALRAAKDEFFRTGADSPLTHEQRHAFAGLAYFPYDPAYRFELPLDHEVSADTVTLETSTGESQTYRRAGKARFAIEGSDAEVTLFRSEAGELFLPLRDATSGEETYGAGRYLEPTMLDDDRVLVDFNDLYNPYCAYNEAWGCPLPPRENWLTVPIRAGEQSFH